MTFEHIFATACVLIMILILEGILFYKGYENGVKETAKELYKKRGKRGQVMLSDRWEKNLEMLKSCALGDVNTPETLLKYWKMQESAGYPNASENVKYFEDMVRKEGH